MIKYFSLFILLYSSAYSQWTPCGPTTPKESAFNQFILSGDSVYGIKGKTNTYVTGLDEISWKKRNFIIPQNYFHFNVFGGNIYLNYQQEGKGENKTIFTSDNGFTWQDAFPEFTSDKYITKLFLTDHLFIAITSNGTYLSKNKGIDWKKIEDDKVSKFAGSFYISDTGDTILSCNSTSAFTSLDRGKTWKEAVIDSICGNSETKLPFIYNGDLIITSKEDGFYYSMDGGATWLQNKISMNNSNAFLYDSFFVTSVEKDGLRFFGKKDNKYELLRSALKGISVFDFYPNKNSIIVNTSKGCLLSTDYGETWSSKNDGITDYYINYIGKFGDEIVISTSSGIPFSTTNHGDSWKAFPADTGFSNFTSIDKRDDLIIYSSYYFNNLYVSTNNGKDWSSNLGNPAFEPLRALSVSILDNGNILARAKDGIYISSDTIKTWKKVDTSHSAFSLASFGINNDGIFSASDEGVLISTDKGLSWQKVNYNFTGSRIKGIKVQDSFVIANSYDSTLYISKDYGKDWKTVNTPCSAINSTCIAEDKIFICSSKEGIYLTRDFGESWESVSGEITDYGIVKLLVDGGDIFAGTAAKSVFKAKLTDLDHIGVVDEAETEGNNFLRIYYPRPIPAKQTVRAFMQWDISLDIEKDDISVYNLFGKVAGREDITIQKTAPYSGYLVWDCSRYEPGVYFIVVRHGDATRMIKVIVND
ncbi:MAG: WD40/YVTN/BNR-like repeat-containing protein [Chloroflexota bacterium]